MKLLVNVTGLKKIVFNQSVVYKLREQNGNQYWERIDGGGKRPDNIISYAKMCAKLWAIGIDPKNDVWVHGDTYNAITHAKMKVKSTKPKNKRLTPAETTNGVAAVEFAKYQNLKHNLKEISFRGNPKTEWK